MQLRALGYLTGVLSFLAAHSPEGLTLCPEGRSLDQQLEKADAVVIGVVTSDRDCPRYAPDTTKSRVEFVDCIGRRAYLQIRGSWKGPAKIGESLRLTMPAPDDSAGLSMRKGETHVVFARLFGTVQDATWLARTTACMLPEGTTSSDSSLVEQLNRWQKTQKS